MKDGLILYTNVTPQGKSLEVQFSTNGVENLSFTYKHIIAKWPSEPAVFSAPEGGSGAFLIGAAIVMAVGMWLSRKRVQLFA